MKTLSENRRYLIKLALWLMDSIVPKKDTVIIVTYPDGDDQGVALCLALQKRNWEGSVQWLVDGEIADFASWKERRGITRLNLEFFKKNSLLGVWSSLRARWVFYTHGLYFSYPSPRGKTVVNLWHGMPIKRTWRGVTGASIAPQASLLCSTAPFYSGVLKRASGFRWNQILESGLPRNDLLLNPRPEVIETVRRLRCGAERLILFLPTYRQSKVGFITHDGEESGYLLGLNDDDAARLHAWLKVNHCKLLVKPHPMSVMAGSQFPEDAHWGMIDELRLRREGIGLYELLSQADLLITDISSIYVDFLATARPQIFFFPDQEKYKNSRGMLLNPLEDFTPGPLTNNYEQLEAALDEWVSGRDPWIEKRMRLQALLIPPQRRSAAEQILEFVGVLKSAAGTSQVTHLACPPVAALVWAQYGPYHFARLREFSKHVDVVRVLGVEIGSKSTTYAWTRNESAMDLHTLCPGLSAEKAPLFTIYRQALRYFSEEQVEVVFVASYWPASSLALILAARMVGAKVVMMNESHAHTAKAKGIWAVLKQWLVQQFDAALVGGTVHKAYFSKLGLNPRAIALGYDAVDNAHFAAMSAKARSRSEEVRAKHGLPKRYFLNVGRMVWKKNLELLVDAYAQTRARVGSECPSLVLVGSGGLEQKLRERCLALGLTISLPVDRGGAAATSTTDVYFMGFKQVQDLPDFYALAEVFVLPSHTEEWGLVVNEAMACGLAVLVSRVAGCAPDLVHEGKNGHMFDPSDIEGLSRHLEEIARQPERARAMGAASIEIISHWGCERFAEGARHAMEYALQKT